MEFINLIMIATNNIQYLIKYLSFLEINNLKKLKIEIKMDIKVRNKMNKLWAHNIIKYLVNQREFKSIADFID